MVVAAARRRAWPGRAVGAGRRGLAVRRARRSGYAYDLRLKGTAWSWLPFAVGIPILPVYGWLGAAGRCRRRSPSLVPAAVLAGAALAIGNSLVDVERDPAAGRTSVAARLGAARAARLVILLIGGVVLIAVGSAIAAGVTSLAVGGLLAAGAPRDRRRSRGNRTDRRVAGSGPGGSSRRDRQRGGALAGGRGLRPEPGRGSRSDGPCPRAPIPGRRSP